jgi:predicted amidophosphoribosyltransferase
MTCSQQDVEEKMIGYERCPNCDKPLEPCGSCPQCGEYPDSPCHKAYLKWEGWNGPSPMWDTFRAGWQAALAEVRVGEKDSK